MKSQVRILIIDDEPVIKEVLQLAFQDEDWQVAKAATGEEALRRLGEGEFEVLVVDKNLPGMSGVDFIREVRKRNRIIRVLMITAYGSVESAVETLNLGIDAYLEKPFPNVRDVVRAVRVALARFDDRWLEPGALELSSPVLRSREPEQASAGRDLEILVGAPEEQVGTWIASHLDDRDRVQVLAASQEILASVSRANPDLVILEGSFASPDITELIAAINAVAPTTCSVVVADGLGLETIKRLIDLQVKALIERTADSGKLRRRMGELVTELRCGSPRAAGAGSR